jgi:hypothetical protein
MSSLRSTPLHHYHSFIHPPLQGLGNFECFPHISEVPGILGGTKVCLGLTCALAVPLTCSTAGFHVKCQREEAEAEAHQSQDINYSKAK